MSLKIYRRLTSQTAASNVLMETLAEGVTVDSDSGLTPETGYTHTFQRELPGYVFDPVEVSATTLAVAVNQAPTASAGNDQTIAEGNTLTLIGSGSDADGTIASYAWSKVSGGAAAITSPSAATTTITGLVLGSYVFRLTVTDNSGATATDDVGVTVTSNILLADDFPGTSISSVNWLVTDASDSNAINISQSEKLLFSSSGTQVISSPDTNNVISQAAFNNAEITIAGKLELTGSDLASFNNYFQLRKDASNMVLLTRDTSAAGGVNARVIIKVAGTNVYDYKSTVPMSGKTWKIHRTAANRIYIYYHNGTSWVELDAATVKTHNIGTGLKVYMACSAYTIPSTYTIDQVRVTNADYSTLLP